MSTSIASSIPGRLRLRHPNLRSREASEHAHQVLSARPGVRSVDSDVRTGSLLVLYDPVLVEEASLVAELGLGEAVEDAPPAQSGAIGAALPRYMGLSLALSLGAAALKVKWLHVAAGAAFVALVGVHVAKARRRVAAHGSSPKASGDSAGM